MIISISTPNKLASVIIYNFPKSKLKDLTEKLKAKFLISVLSEAETSLAKLAGTAGLIPFNESMLKELYGKCEYQNNENPNYQGFVNNNFVEIRKVKLTKNNSFVYNPCLIQLRWTTSQQAAAELAGAKKAKEQTELEVAIGEFIGPNNFKKQGTSPIDVIKRMLDSNTSVLVVHQENIVKDFKFLTKFFVHKDNAKFQVVAELVEKYKALEIPMPTSVNIKTKPEQSEEVIEEQTSDNFLVESNKQVVIIQPTRPKKADFATSADYQVALERFNVEMKQFMQHSNKSVGNA